MSRPPQEASDREPVRLEPVGFWRNGWDAATKDMPDPRTMVDDDWPLRQRVRVARYLRRGRRLVAYAGFSTCRFECGIPWSFMGCWDLGDDRYVWPEGFAHYVEHHAVRPPAQFLEHIEPRLGWLWPWWRLGAWWRRARVRLRVRLAARDERRQQRKKKETPLHRAVRDHDRGRVEALLAEGAEVDATDEYGLTPLALTRRFEIAKVLIAAGAALDPSPAGHITPLQQAASAGDLAWCRYVLDRGARVDATDKLDRTALDRAHTAGVVTLLLEAGADARRGAPLYWPAHAGDLESLRRLTAAGAEVDAQLNRHTALMAAARSDNGDAAVELLLEAGADVHVRSEIGETALIKAASRNSLATVERLLAAGASPTVMTTRKVGALHMAALGNRGREGSPEVLARLLDAGAGPIDARDKWGRTALRIAAEYGGVEDVRVLLAAGADPKIPDKKGVGPRAVAERRGESEIVAALDGPGGA